MASGEKLADGKQALGAFIRRQRKLANLTLRELARRTDISNPYLSQLERGLHQPSVRVLKALAAALDVSAETLLTHAGVLGEQRAARAGTGHEAAPENGATAGGAEGPASAAEGPASGAEGPGRTVEGQACSVEEAVGADPDLNDTQKRSLISVYRSYLAGNRAARTPAS